MAWLNTLHPSYINVHPATASWTKQQLNIHTLHRLLVPAVRVYEIRDSHNASLMLATRLSFLTRGEKARAEIDGALNVDGKHSETP